MKISRTTVQLSISIFKNTLPLIIPLQTPNSNYLELGPVRCSVGDPLALHETNQNFIPKT